MSQSPEIQIENQPNPGDAWADKYGAALRPVALQFGQPVFEFTMRVGMAQHSIQIMTRRIRGNMELMKALSFLADSINQFATLWLLETNNMENFQACKTAIESSQPAIMVPESASKIILPS